MDVVRVRKATLSTSTEQAITGTPASRLCFYIVHLSWLDLHCHRLHIDYQLQSPVVGYLSTDFMLQLPSLVMSFCWQYTPKLARTSKACQCFGMLVDSICDQQRKAVQCLLILKEHNVELGW
jgi:hypothetical protein